MSITKAIVCDRCGQHQLFDRNAEALYAWAEHEITPDEWVDVCPACQDQSRCQHDTFHKTLNLLEQE